MDEAEMISDRIIMLHQGKLICTGSPLYLKAKFGSGYHLTVAKYMPTASDEENAGEGRLKFFKSFVHVSMHVLL